MILFLFIFNNKVRTINMNSIDQLSYLNTAIITTSTPRIITTIAKDTTTSTTSTEHTTKIVQTTSSSTTKFSTTTTITLADTLLELSGELVKLDTCFMENDILYFGNDIEVKETVESIHECCSFCVSKLGCKSWVFSQLNKTCALKASFHGEGFVHMEGYSSGFIDPKCK